MAVNDVKCVVPGWVQEQGIEDTVRCNRSGQPFIAPGGRELHWHPTWIARYPIERQLLKLKEMWVHGNKKREDERTPV